MKKQLVAKQQNKKKRVSPSGSMKSSKTMAVTSRLASMKLLAGSSSCKTSYTIKKTTTNNTDKSAGSKKPSLKPTLQPRTKHKEQTDAKVQTSLQSSVRISAKAERRNSLQVQMKKTAAKKDMNSNRLDTEKDETRKVSVRTRDKLPGTRHIKVKEADEMSKFGTIAESTVKEEGQMTTLHNQKGMPTDPYYWQNLEQFNQKLMELKFSYDVNKRMRVSNAFSSIKRRSLRQPKRTTLKPFEKTAPLSYNGTGLVPLPFVRNTKYLTSADGKIISPTSDPDYEALLNGLPNLGRSCYINASLQCLLSAKAFCDELTHLLDASSRSTGDTFFRCFAELSRLRNGCEVRGNFNKHSLLYSLINSAATTKPEFTVYEQNDAHEFLCHCLTHMEMSGQEQGWQKHVHPKCPVKTNFMFKMRNIITCSSCGAQQNNKVDVFNHLSLPLVSTSVDQCLYNLVNEDTDIERTCSLCEGKCARSSWTFHTLPRFLILQLNRFKLSQHYTVVKVDTSVTIDPELKIDCLPRSDVTGSDNNTAGASETGGNELGGTTSTYRLISVLSHFGASAEYGHYACDCFEHDFHEWTTYNDELSIPTTETDVLCGRASNAYVLLYERLNTS